MPTSPNGEEAVDTEMVGTIAVEVAMLKALTALLGIVEVEDDL